MALMECKTLNEARNNEKNGFMELEGKTIQDTAKFIRTGAKNNESAQSSKNIAHPNGVASEWMMNVRSSVAEVRKPYEDMLKILMILLAIAPYKGMKIEFKTHTFSQEDPLAKRFIEAFKTMEGWNKAPDKVLELNIDGRTCGLFVPDWKFFIPAADFRDTHIERMTPEDYLDKNPHIKERYRALLTEQILNGANADVLSRLLDAVGGPLSEDGLAVYKAEKRESIPYEAEQYIRLTAPGADAAVACGYSGTNTSKKLLDTLTVIITDRKAVPLPGIKAINEHMSVIPPVRDTYRLEKISYRFGTFAENNMPEWIEVTAVLDGRLYHHIYTMGNSGWRTCRPENYINLFNQIPDGILRKYNYLVQDSAAPYIGNDEVEAFWTEFPEDPEEQIAELMSRQYRGESWKIHQRSTQIRRLDLTDKEGNMYGSIFPEENPVFKPAINTMNVAIDPAGATSVRLAGIPGVGNSGEVTCSDLIYPLTPMTQKDLNQSMERHTGTANVSGTHFDSLLQRYHPLVSGGWSRLAVEGRIWQPNQKDLFEALKAYPGTMSAALAGLGVISNPKEMATRSNLTDDQKADCMIALKMYIGSLIFESVLALSKDGFSIKAGNLKFLISYPDNGSGEGITDIMKEAIEGAVEFTNEFLSTENQLAIGCNVILHSESEATAEWHKNNAPAMAFLGALTAVATPDYGYSTHDYSLRANGHLYTFSIPYAAQNITNATLAKVYEGDSLALTRCFTGGNQELMKGAEEAIKTAMSSQQGKLYERLGFTLPLNRLFNNCKFNVTGANADKFQKMVQQIVEAKLNVAIPAYADSIARAVQENDLSLTSEIFLAPVGKGSLAFNNTEKGFEERFITRLKAQIKAVTGKDFSGKIQILPNNDTEKISVAQGLLDMAIIGTPAGNHITGPDPVEHYLDLAFQNNDPAKTVFRTNMNNACINAAKKQFIQMRKDLSDKAFDRIMNSLTYEFFVSNFNCWGYIGTGTGDFDEKIRQYAKVHFQNLKDELKQNRKSLIMSCVGIERELACGAMTDLCIERMPLWDNNATERN